VFEGILMVSILLVEDEVVEALDLKNQLESFGYSVPDIASNGEEAVNKVMELQPDLVLMDIVLKGDTDGIGVASEIKKLNTPVVYLTGHYSEPTFQKAMLTDPYGYLVKPCNIHNLKFTIEVALQKSKQILSHDERDYLESVDNSMVAVFKTSLDGDILFVNKAMADRFKFETVDEVLRKKSLDLYKNPSDRQRFIEELKQGYSAEDEFEMLTSDGKVINILIRAHLTDEVVFGTMLNITKRVQAENKLKESLSDKEVLLREIHHRVKNNLQIISSLLSLQERYVEDDSVDLLKESQGRVKTMAMIHEKLYQSPTFTNIRIKEYIMELVNNVLYSYGVNGSIVPEFDIEDLKVDIDTGIPLGLIINELVTNSIKYAFPQRSGNIKLQFKSNDDYELLVADDGVGLPEDVNIETTDSLGLQLVNSLVKQLDGRLEVDRNEGTKYKIIFKRLKYNEGI
jgi:PAS domain S-box-containing protein